MSSGSKDIDILNEEKDSLNLLVHSMLKKSDKPEDFAVCAAAAGLLSSIHTTTDKSKQSRLISLLKHLKALI